MPTDFSDAAKAKQIREFFQRHGRIYIVVDATGDDVEVPERFRGDPALRLVLNVRMPQPIYIRTDAIESEFSFGGVPYPCRIPMRRIWAMYVPGREQETGVVWERDVPEIIRAVAQAARASAAEEPEEPQQARSEEEKAQTDTNEHSPEPSKPRRVRHLRVIK